MKKIIKKIIFKYNFSFKIFYEILILFPKLISYFKPLVKLPYVNDKKLLHSKKLGRLHPNQTLKGNFISLLILLIDIEEVLNLKIFKDFNFLKISKNKKMLSQFHHFFLINLKSINQKYPHTAYSIFKIYFGNFKLLGLDKKKLKTDQDLKFSCLLDEIYSYKYFEHFQNNKFIKKKILKYIDDEHDYLKSLIVKYCIEQKFSDFKLFTKAVNKIKLKKKKNYNINYGNNILGSNLYAYGHLINFIDILHRKKKLNLSQNKKIVISPNYIANNCLANYLKERYKNLCVIDHRIFIKCLYDRKILSNDLLNLEEIDKPFSLYQLPYREFIKHKDVSSSIENRLFNKIIKRQNISALQFKEPYAVIILRDNIFKSYDKNLKVNDDRYSNPEYILKLIELLNQYGFKAVLINGKILTNLDKKKFNFFDYSSSSFRNDYNDLLIYKNSSFAIRLGTSSSALNLLFNKYQFNINYPLNRKPIFHNKSYYLPKKIIFNNRLISNSNYFNNDLFINHDYKILSNKGYNLVDNDWHETKEAFKVFYDNFSKNKTSVSNNETINFYYPINIINI